MTAGPLFAFHGVSKAYGGAWPLKINRFELRAGSRIILAGIDPLGAEMFMHVLTGAALPEEGRVEVFGTPTSAITTDTAWLESLDRFGLVSNRAVLLDQSSVAQNLALPITLSIDPMDPAVRAEVERLAAETGVSASRLDIPAGSMTPIERMRVHLARALASSPQVLLLEHPTVTLGGESAAFGATLKQLTERRNLTWLAISDDEAFQRASGGEVMHVSMSTGAVRSKRGWRRWFSSK